MNFLYKAFLKATNRDLYRRKKLEEHSKRIEKELQKFEKESQKFIDQAKALQFEFPPENKEHYTFRHSGNSGDIIYSLPTLFALTSGVKATLYLNLDQPANYAVTRGTHPLGKVMLDSKMFSMLRPLLLSQPKISQCESFNGETIDYDLDIFRNSLFPQHAGNIARWYFLHFAVNADLGKPWLHVNPNQTVSDYIVVARSLGYHSPGIDYSFLDKYGKLLFVGVPEEFEAIRKMLPSIEYYPVSDFLELAEVIAGSKLFIGNQSFPFSIAEAMKVRRVLEVCYFCPNVIVEGSDGYDFCYQPQFERIIDRLARQ
jgi:hypothetical protein